MRLVRAELVRRESERQAPQPLRGGSATSRQQVGGERERGRLPHGT